LSPSGDAADKGTPGKLQPGYLILGEVLRPHGVRGELRLRVLTDYPERIAQLQHVFVGKATNDTQAEQYRVLGSRLHQQYVLLTLYGINDRDDADRLRGRFVMVDRENAVPLEEGEHWLHELLGLKILDESGAVLGELAEILETGANDVYVVIDENKREILLPAHAETILEMNVDGGYIRMAIPDGLLD
jgi:16S rRNA processing protein RimM